MATLTKDAVTLYDIRTNSVWRRMSHQDGEAELAACRRCGDTLQEYATTSRDGQRLRVVLQVDATGSQAGIDPGGIYEFTA